MLRGLGKLWPHDHAAWQVINDDVGLRRFGVLYASKPHFRCKNMASLLLFLKIFYWHQSVNLTYLTKTVKQSTAPPRSQSSHYVPSILHSVVARFCQKRATHLSHLHDPMRNDWQILHTDLTEWCFLMQHQISTVPELVSGGLFLFLFLYFWLDAIVGAILFLCININILWAKCTVQWEKS